MRETLKTRPLRLQRGDFDAYLHGRGLDVGCGNDLLEISDGTVLPWDIEDGDAQYLAGVADASFDFVYSSHCLEHLVDVPTAIENWARVVRTGGFIYFVVPDYVRYEHMQWPSVGNRDHKHSFSLGLPRAKVKRPNHWCIQIDLHPVLSDLGLRVRRMYLEDTGYDYSLPPTVDQTLSGALAQICVIMQKL